MGGNSKKKNKTINPLVPEVNDPNHYCRACKKTCLSRAYYKSHLFKKHTIVIRTKYGLTKHPELTPDIDDPNGYCKSCERVYCGKIYYWQHMQTIHKKKLPPYNQYKKEKKEQLEETKSKQSRSAHGSSSIY